MTNNIINPIITNYLVSVINTAVADKAVTAKPGTYRIADLTDADLVWKDDQRALTIRINQTTDTILLRGIVSAIKDFGGGESTITFPEAAKPVAESEKPVEKPKVKRTRKTKQEAKQPFAITFNPTDKAKVQGIMAKAKAKCGDASKANVEFFMVAGSNSIVLSFYNAAGKKAKGGVYPGMTSLQMGEGNQRNGNELVLAYTLDSTEVENMLAENWNGTITA